MEMKKCLIAGLILVSPLLCFTQEQNVTRTIESFGAVVNDGKDDTEAFYRAAVFFNERGGRGSLVLGNGTYLVGKQTSQGEKLPGGYFINTPSALLLYRVNNFKITGSGKSIVKVNEGLKYGTFDNLTQRPLLNVPPNFLDYTKAAAIGDIFYFKQCSNILLSGIEMDGNVGAMILGGGFGDIGTQIKYNGLVFEDCSRVTIEKTYCHHFGLDGMMLSNIENDQSSDDISILDSRFEYNGRQGLSWIGGKGLKVFRTSFSFSGKASIHSPPCSGVDIEPEIGPISDGYFEDCTFENNRGVGLLAEVGDSRNCAFERCVFWGVNTWSIWVKKPSYRFSNSKIFGSVVHGFNAKDPKEATIFERCNFSDSKYNQESVYGTYLMELNDAANLLVKDCNFEARYKKLLWINQGGGITSEVGGLLQNCQFLFETNLPANDFVAVLRNIKLQSCRFSIKGNKNYYIEGVDVKSSDFKSKMNSWVVFD